MCKTVLIKTGLIFLITSLAGCGHSLDSLDGPETGKASGLICESLEMLAAAKDISVQELFVKQGGCIKIASHQKKTVKVIKTVMMPGDQKYSQIEYLHNNTVRNMWMPTARF